MNKFWRSWWGAAAIGLEVLLLSTGGQVIAQSRLTDVQAARWFEVRQVRGTVSYSQGATRRPAPIGQRIQAVGEGITTGKGASTTLLIDQDMGFVNLAENTTLRIASFQKAPDGGRITRLQVTGGQARFQVRPFTHRTSRLEVQTPGGVSAVRGTEFGLSVQPSGRTGLVTTKGRVDAIAQGQTVVVGAGYQSLMVPGYPPTPATPFQDTARLTTRLVREVNDDVRYVRIEGHTDPVNIVMINGLPQSLDRMGRFSMRYPAKRRIRLSAVVTTPTGQQRTYRLRFRT